MWDKSELIPLHNQTWLSNQKVAGKCVASILKSINNLISQKTPNLNLLDLEQEAYKQLKEFNCEPTFLGYKGFPSCICISVNKELVHGIPKNYIIKEGDIIKFDLGATFNGAIADAAATAIYGKEKSIFHKEMVETCREALLNAIKVISVGKQLGVIGNAISKTVKKGPFGLVTEYGGHGLDVNNPHALPFVPNKSQPNEGPRFQNGMTIAIEPMFVLGSTVETKVDSDGWTVIANDVTSHFEHTIFVEDNKVLIITE